MDRRMVLKGLAGATALMLAQPAVAASEREGVSVWYWNDEDPIQFWERSWRVGEDRKTHVARVYRTYLASMRENTWMYHVRLGNKRVYERDNTPRTDVWEAMDAADRCLQKHGIGLGDPIVFGPRKFLRPGSVWQWTTPTAWYPENFYGEGVEVVHVSPCFRTIRFAVPDREFGSIHTVSTDGFLAAFRPIS